jgi:hypothetical protein
MDEIRKKRMQKERLSLIHGLYRVKAIVNPPTPRGLED